MLYYQEQKLIGYLLGLYRRQRAYFNQNYNIESFVEEKSPKVKELCAICKKECVHHKNICSSYTTYKIEHGYVAKNICYYIDFSTKLGKLYVLNQETHQQLKDLLDQTLNLIYAPEIHALQNLRCDLENKKTEWKNYILFSEMVDLLKGIVDILTGEGFPKAETTDILEFLFDYTEGTIRHLISFYLFAVYHFRYKNIEKRSKYTQYYQSCCYKDSYLEMVCLYLTSSPDKMLSYLEKRKLNEKNKVWIYTFYQLKALCLYKKKMYDEATIFNHKAFKAAETLTKLQKIEPIKLGGMIAYAYGEYANALFLLKVVANYNVNLLGRKMIVMLDCFKRENRLNEVEPFLKSLKNQDIYHDITKIIFQYYYQWHCRQKSKHELQNDILELLSPILPVDSLYFEIIYQDMCEFCKMNRNYKMLYLLGEGKKLV